MNSDLVQKSDACSLKDLAFDTNTKGLMCRKKYFYD